MLLKSNSLKPNSRRFSKSLHFYVSGSVFRSTMTSSPSHIQSGSLGWESGPKIHNKSMDVNPEMCLLWHMKTAQCREHGGVHIAQTLLSQRCEVRVFISFELLEANNKAYQGCCVALKRANWRCFPAAGKILEIQKWTKMGRVWKKENDLQMEHRGMPKVLKMFYFNPNSLSIACCL